MIILVWIGCFMAGAVVGIVMMSLCVASHNSSLELENRQRRIKSNADSKRRYNQRYYWRDCIS